MWNTKTINVDCKCWQKLVRYEKVGKWRLQKMYLDKILKDYTWELFDALKLKEYQIWDQLNCTSCEKRIATILRMRWRMAAKVNHWTVKDIRT